MGRGPGWQGSRGPHLLEELELVRGSRQVGGECLPGRVQGSTAAAPLRLAGTSASPGTFLERQLIPWELPGQRLSGPGGQAPALPGQGLRGPSSGQETQPYPEWPPKSAGLREVGWLREHLPALIGLASFWPWQPSWVDTAPSDHPPSPPSGAPPCRTQHPSSPAQTRLVCPSQAAVPSALGSGCHCWGRDSPVPCKAGHR